MKKNILKAARTLCLSAVALTIVATLATMVAIVSCNEDENLSHEAAAAAAAVDSVLNKFMAEDTRTTYTIPSDLSDTQLRQLVAEANNALSSTTLTIAETVTGTKSGDSYTTKSVTQIDSANGKYSYTFNRKFTSGALQLRMFYLEGTTLYSYTLEEGKAEWCKETDSQRVGYYIQENAIPQGTTTFTIRKDGNNIVVTDDSHSETYTITLTEVDGVKKFKSVQKKYTDSDAVKNMVYTYGTAKPQIYGQQSQYSCSHN